MNAPTKPLMSSSAMECSVYILCVPLYFLLPNSIRWVHRNFENGPEPLELWFVIFLMFTCIVILEFGYRFGERLLIEIAPNLVVESTDPKVLKEFREIRTPLIWMRRVLVFGSQLMTIFLYLLTMDGGVRFRACCYIMLIYYLILIPLFVFRWKSWSAIELIFIRWSWVPILAFGLPIFLPKMLQWGLIREIG
jgi:hypothetical protein